MNTVVLLLLVLALVFLLLGAFGWMAVPLSVVVGLVLVVLILDRIEQGRS